jgi:Secretion system C-terminal sorting domain
MKKIFSALLFTVIASLAHAQDPAYPPAPAAPQNIIAAEYFIDTDPGFGSGTAIPFTTGVNVVNAPATITTTGLSNGVHRLVVRTKNNEGAWAISAIRDFLYDADPTYPATPAAPQNITAAEYFIDTDPGFGSGTAIPFTNGVDVVNAPATITTTGLTNGVHRLYIRTRNNEGNWAITNTKDFLYDADPAYTAAPAAPQNIITAEYFIDTDPGFGSGSAIPITQAVDINNLLVSVNTTGLPAATTHHLFLRTKNNEGRWSISNEKVFVVDIIADPVYPTAPPAPQNIIAAEYFIDTDPGFGNGNAVSILTTAVDITNILTTPSLVGLSNGAHRIYLRSKSNEGRWSITNIKDFLYDADPVYAAAPPAPGNITYAEYYFDTDPGFGNGTLITITTPAVNLSNIPFTADVTALSNNANHTLFVRSLDDWSVTNYTSFLKGVALPVTWLFVKAQLTNGKTTVSWATAQESNTGKFEIEHSTDGRSFIKVGETAAAGNTSATTNYSFTHTLPVNGFNYYRIKQIDNDGKFKYSDVVTVLKKDNLVQTIIAPNPVKDILHVVETKETFIGTAEIYNAAGSLVLRKLINASRQIYGIPVSNLINGAYVLKITYKDATKTYPFIKQ